MWSTSGTCDTEGERQPLPPGIHSLVGETVAMQGGELPRRDVYVGFSETMEGGQGIREVGLPERNLEVLLGSEGTREAGRSGRGRAVIC